MAESLAAVIDADRFWATLDAAGDVGAIPGGGVRRLALSDSDKAMRDKFVGWCDDEALSIEVDPVGNIYSHLAGSDPDLPPVVIGSHLDSQMYGGRYDGTLGVLAGLDG